MYCSLTPAQLGACSTSRASSPPCICMEDSGTGVTVANTWAASWSFPPTSPAPMARPAGVRSAAVWRRADHRDPSAAPCGCEAVEPLPSARISEATLYNWRSRYGGMQVAIFLLIAHEARTEFARSLKAVDRARRENHESANGICPDRHFFGWYTPIGSGGARCY